MDSDADSKARDRERDRAASQQRFLSLFLRSEREIFRYMAALVPNVVDAEDIVQQAALAAAEPSPRIAAQLVSALRIPPNQ